MRLLSDGPILVIRWLCGIGLLALGISAAAPTRVAAQLVTFPDFDICDYCGTLEGNTARLRGRVSFGSERGVFRLINASSEIQDVDRDGYHTGVDFTNLAVVDTTNFVNVDDPAIAILKTNFVLADFMNPLNEGFQQDVSFYVNIPAGTPAGTYVGQFTVEDTLIGIAANPNGETLGRDHVNVEVIVLEAPDVTLIEPDSAAELDSLVLRGRAGQTVSGVVRLGNTGNVELSNVRVEVTDLVAVSGTGLRVRRERITISPTVTSTLAVGDTTRLVVTVRIPTGILAGTYRGDLIVQGEGVPERRIPLVLIVTTPGEIVFEDNPVRVREHGNAIIIFNADPGSRWQIRIFDMLAFTTWAAEGTVFAGGPVNGPGPIEAPGDQAVRYTWPLINGDGEPVASGMYLVVVDVFQDGVRQQLRDKLMVIR